MDHDDVEITIGITRKTVNGQRVDVPFINTSGMAELDDPAEAMKLAARFSATVDACYKNSPVQPQQK